MQCVLEMIERSLRQPKDSFLLLPRKQALVGAKVIHSKYYKYLRKLLSTDILADKEWTGFWQISLYIQYNLKILNNIGI